MSLNISEVASSFGCSESEVKELLVGVTANIPDMINIIKDSISSDDFSDISIATDMIRTKINHFNLTDIESAIDSLDTAASNNDKATLESSFTALNSAFSDVMSAI